MATPTTSGSVTTTTSSGLGFVDALLGGAQWTAHDITYSLPGASAYWSTSWTDGYGDYWYSGNTGGEPWVAAYEPLTAAEASRFVAALQTWANVADIKFVKVADNQSVVGDIRVAYTDIGLDAEAWAYFPSSGDVYSGDVWINSSSSSYHSNFAAGSYSYSTLIHEIGHALGLKHPFEEGSNNTTTLASSGYGSLDSLVYTVMSYSGLAGNSKTWLTYQPTTPMLLDILAIQHMYGANTTFKSGNDVYRYSTTSTYLETIYDTGGVDEIVCDGNGAVYLDLGEGCGSSVGQAIYILDEDQGFLPVGVVDQNLWIAYGVSIENATGGNGNDYLIGNELANRLAGRSGDDQMLGGEGNDILIGGAGNDTMDGGAGSDIYLIGTGQEYGNSERIADSGAAGSDIDEIRFAATVASTLTLSSNMAGVERVVIGSGYGEAAIGSGAVALNINASAVSYGLEIVGNAGANTLIGTGFADILIGGNGDDQLDGGTGADTLEGGKGSDTYVIDNAGDVAIETLTVAQGGGVDTVKSNVSYTLGANLDNLTLMGTGAIDGIGNALNNTLQGNDGSNILDGAEGVDNLKGGLGDDRYLVDLVRNGTTATVQFEDTITEGTNQGDDSVELRLRGDYSFATGPTALSLGANVENLDASATGSLKLNLTGNTLDNTLTGNSTDNILDGGTGSDTLIGGAGNDIYILDNIGDQVIELTGEGTDTLQIKFNVGSPYTLGANIENATLLNTVAFALSGNELDNTLMGNAAANTLTGNDGNDTLDGKAGADTMIGGNGNDIYYVDNALDVVTESGSDTADEIRSTVSFDLSSKGANIENLTLLGTGVINAMGNDLDNILIGNTAANILDGGLGADTMEGGKGGDTYIVDDAGDTVVESLTAAQGGGVDTVKSSVSYTLGDNLDNLTLTGNSNIDGTGNALVNTILGNGADNTMDGAGGADILKGGLGDDTYIVDLVRNGTTATVKLEDSITELANQGSDTVELRLRNDISDYAYATATTTLTLGANLENLDASNTGALNLNLTGNTANNILTGNNADNILNGGVGSDFLIGEQGDDTLIGGLGNDTLTGGGGNDTFRFDTALNAASNVDTITDFTVGDTIQLENQIFSKLTAVGALSGNNFVTTAGDVAHAAGDNNDFVIYDASTGNLYYDADGNGSGVAVQFATLIGVPILGAGDFIVA